MINHIGTQFPDRKRLLSEVQLPFQAEIQDEVQE